MLADESQACSKLASGQARLAYAVTHTTGPPFDREVGHKGLTPHFRFQMCVEYMLHTSCSVFNLYMLEYH